MTEPPAWQDGPWEKDEAATEAKAKAAAEKKSSSRNFGIGCGGFIVLAVIFVWGAYATDDEPDDQGLTSASGARPLRSRARTS